MTGCFKQISRGRILLMLLGNVVLGLGVSTLKLAGLGNDPFNGMVIAVGDFLDIPYANFQVMFNAALLLIEIFAGRKFIGIGTITNALMLGYISTFFNVLLLYLVNEPLVVWQRVIVVVVGVIICSLGLSFYQSADVGLAPYDSLSMILAERWPKIPYFCHRIALDALLVLICYLVGGVVGLGTLVCAFGLGYFINFFNVHLSVKLLRYIDGTANVN